MLKSITMSLVVVSFFGCSNSTNNLKERVETTKTDLIPTKFSPPKNPHSAWLDLKVADSTFIISMPYSSKDNFLKEKIYPCAKCLLRENAARALLAAQKMAQSKGYNIIIFDCYRPLALQQKMFDIKPDPKYVADPKRGSKHNKGAAVDISLANSNGEPLDMGTDFDDFSEKAHFDTKGISTSAHANRKKLREIMLANDFAPYENEWWHFNYIDTEYPNEDFVWDCD